MTAAASDNVYSVATQYSDSPGAVHIQYQSTFGGSYVDHDPLPANGCDDGLDTYCLTDQQLQNEIQTAMTAKGWVSDPSHIFFLMTPNGVGSCESAAGSCSTDTFCAYHSDFVDSSGGHVIYANEPYEGTDPLGGCIDPTQGFPNDPDADTTINTISHEHNEAITDPLSALDTAWIAADGNENGDLCAFGFGNTARRDAGNRRLQPGDQQPPLRPAAGVEQRRTAGASSGPVATPSPPTSATDRSSTRVGP